jgi:pyridoxamine 5'-phosphate oxidase
MDQHEIMYKVEQLLEDSKTGVLATIATDGKPRMRWMTPTILKGRPGVLFAVTSPDFTKIVQLESHPDVEWMIQTRSLNQVVNLRGKINVIDNPSLKSEVMEHLARKLTVFWKVNTEKTDFIVLETVLSEATYFQPMKGTKEHVRFS